MGLLDKAAVTDIVIPEGVTDIGRRAFNRLQANAILDAKMNGTFMNNQRSNYPWKCYEHKNAV